MYRLTSLSYTSVRTANYCNPKCDIQNGRFPDLFLEKTALAVREKIEDEKKNLLLSRVRGTFDLHHCFSVLG